MKNFTANNIFEENISGAAGYFSKQRRRELVIVNPTVSDYQILLSGISPNVEIHILDPNRDGIEQITEILTGKQGSRGAGEQGRYFSPLHLCTSAPLPLRPSAPRSVSEAEPLPLCTPADGGPLRTPAPLPLRSPAPLPPCLHLISHGAPGTLYLGNNTLELSNLEKYRSQLQQWGIAHLYIYGCKVAAGDAGAEFLTKLHHITQAEIYANPQPTGNAALGGTWNLKQILPCPSAPLLPCPPTPYTLHPTPPFSPEALATYPGLLLEPEYEWAANFGSFSYWNYAQGIAVDSSGNVYTTGLFAGTVDFDPGPGTFNLTHVEGQYDTFISKLNADGTFAWAKSFGEDNTSRNIAVDSSGNVYTTGSFNGTVDFDPGAGTFNLTSGINQSLFISKLDSNGNFVWAKSSGSIPVNGDVLAIDSSDNIYTTGAFIDTFDFDPGAGTFNLTSVGSQDAFISKLNADGTFAWAKSFGGSSEQEGRSIAVDSSDNVYTAGTFQGTADFDPGPGTFNLTSAGDYDAFISKLNADGTFAWAKSFEGKGYDGSVNIAVDSSGNVYTAGTFRDTLDFGPDPGSFNLTSVGYSDIFISKWNADGTFAWAKSFGGSSNDEAISVITDSSGNVYTTGIFQNTVDFDPGPGTFNLTASGYGDAFISKWNADGTFAWAKSFGGSGSDTSYSITTDSSDSIYTTGYFEGTADFDPGLGTANLTSAGARDIFISKLVPGVAPTVTSVTSTTSDGTYGPSGSINVTVNFSEPVTLAGGDMTVTLDTGGLVTITPFTHSASAVGTYTPAPGQNSADLNSTSITLATGATLKDGVGNDATTLTIPTGQSLADSKAIIVDTIAPTINLTTDAAAIVSAPFTVTATFSETAANFELTDITVSGGIAGNLQTTDNIAYTFDVTPTADGNVTVDIAAATATDIAGNDNIAATPLTRTADIINPTIALNSNAANTVNGVFTVTAIFSEAVTDFVAADIVVGNGTVGNLQTTDNITYTFDVTPATDGKVTVDVAANSATNAAGDNNLAAIQLTRTVDMTAPTVVLSSDAADTVNGAFAVTATFSENATGFDVSDITVGNGTAGNFKTVNAKTYTFDITPTADGEVTVDVAAAKATDIAGNNNIAATPLTRTADMAAPTVALSSDAADTVDGAFTVTATFSEAVTDFVAEDIVVGNGTVGNLQTTDNITYTFDVTPAAFGNVVVNIPAATATDAVGNDNTAATQLTRTYIEDLPPGVFVVGNDGRVNVEFLLDGGSYQGEMALFRLEGMEDLQVGSPAYMQEAARRALSGPAQEGYVVISDRTDAARFTDLNAELEASNWNSGDYRGVQGFAMTPWTKFAIMLVPHGTVEDVSNSPELLRGARVPFFSTQTAQGQMVDLTGNGNTFAWEDLPINGNSDRDYNDLIFRMTGAIGATAAVDDWINPDKDWRPSDLGEELLDYATTGQTAIPAPPTVPNPTNWSIRAWAMDGYIANAEVFFDANKNGVRDDNEPTTMTNGEGLLDLDLSLTEFDTNGNGQLDPEEGHIMVVGGTDTANGLPLETPLKATPDAAVVSLLTSLVADLIDLGLSPLEANDQVKQVLSLPDNVDLTSFDPIAATDEQLVGGVETNLAMVQLQNFITQTVGLISGASTLNKTQITLSVVNSLASDIIDQATLDLTSAEQLQPLVEAAAQKVAAIDSSLDLDQVLQATPGAATVMASANQALAEAVANGDTGVNEAIAIVQKVSLDITTQELTAVGAKELSIEEAIANNTGDPLSDRIYGSSDIDESGGNGIFPISPSQIPPFTGLSSILPSDESSNNNQNNTPLSVPPAIPSEPTVDLINISFTAIGTDSAENIDATPNNDVISGQGGDDIIRGLPGNDALFGNDGNDELHGNQGADLLLGNQGKDSIYGGQGNDLGIGGQGNDLIYGDLGSDTLIGDMGDDTLFGGTSKPGSVASDAGDLLLGKDGNDFLHGNAGDDSISGGNDNDTARGGQGNDLIHGDAGNDILYGDKGDDSLAGGTENDLLYGGEGNDILWGGDGGDFLFGGEGDDTLTGGAGQDYFVLQSSFGSDTIVDFTDGNDLIGLIGGLTFEQLNITGSNGNTLIASGNELLATLTGVDVGLITSADFTLMV